MKIPTSFSIQLAGAVLIAGTAKGGNVSPGTVLRPSFEYSLIGAPVVAGGGPSVPNPGVDVSLNPQPLPPFPDPGANLDLTPYHHSIALSNLSEANIALSELEPGETKE